MFLRVAVFRSMSMLYPWFCKEMDPGSEEDVDHDDQCTGQNSFYLLKQLQSRTLSSPLLYMNENTRCVVASPRSDPACHTSTPSFLLPCCTLKESLACTHQPPAQWRSISELKGFSLSKHITRVWFPADPWLSYCIWLASVISLKHYHGEL